MLPERETLSELRLSLAKQCLVSAEALLQINDERGAVNRAYYAVFHAIRSVLILEGMDFAKHSGVISYFRKEYIKTGVFSADISDTITDLFNSRSSSDYDDHFDFSKDEVVELLKESADFVAVIEEYHKNRKA